jgi:hypothetical protein
MGAMVSRLALRRGVDVEPIPLDRAQLSRGW